MSQGFKWTPDIFYDLITTPLDEFVKKYKISRAYARRYRNWAKLVISSILANSSNKNIVDVLSESALSLGIEEYLPVLASSIQKKEELVEKYKEVELLREQNRYLKKINKHLIKELSEVNTVISFIQENLKSFEPVPVPPPQIPDNKVVESVVCLFSDWHIGEVIKKSEVNGLNEYNFEIFTKRLEYLITKIIKFTKKNMVAHVFDELNIFFLGDMVSGIIHDDLVETNQMSIVEQTMLGAYVTAQALLELAMNFPKVRVYCIVGNHGRLKRTKYAKRKQVDNWDFIFYHFLKLFLDKQKNVEFHIPESTTAVVEVKGHLFVLFHGDTIRRWMDIPFYGINRTALKHIELGASQGKFYRYFVMGHHHQKISYQEGLGGERIMNGCLSGISEYAYQFPLVSKPVQLMFAVHEKYGKTWELPIDVAFGDKEIKRSRYVIPKLSDFSFDLEKIIKIINGGAK